MADPRGVASTIVVPSEDPKKAEKKVDEPEHREEHEANDAALKLAKDEINKEIDELVRPPPSPSWCATHAVRYPRVRKISRSRGN